MSGVVKAVTGGLATLFGGGSAPTIKQPEPKQMPDPNDPMRKVAAQKEQARKSTSGRQSTLLSGGGDYFTSPTLG